MPKVDLDFARYVARKRGAREAQAREGAAYAYGGDLKVRRALERLPPVRLALEATVRLWGGKGPSLERAQRVTLERLPQLTAALERCADVLHVEAPRAYVVDLVPEGAVTLGSDEEPRLFIARGLLERLSEGELAFVVGRECGRVQNVQVRLSTALHLLEHQAGDFTRWVVTPARLALSAWARRAAFTLDRAGLLCARDLSVAQASLAKLALGEEAARRRASAIAHFAESAIYRGAMGQPGGTSAGECDARVAELLGGIFGGSDDDGPSTAAAPAGEARAADPRPAQEPTAQPQDDGGPHGPGGHGSNGAPRRGPGGGR